MKRAIVVADEGDQEERVHTNMAAVVEGEEREQHSSGNRRSGEIFEEDGDCKRQRTKSMCTVTTVEEQVCSTRIRLFKWNESWFNEKYSDCGIFMIRVYNNIKNRSPSPDGTFVYQEKNEFVSLFKLTHLLQTHDSSGDLMKSVALMALADTDAFAEDSTIEALAEEISTYLSSNFRFTKRTLSCPRTRRIVLLVEVDMVMTKEYRVIEDDETIMAIHQDCGNGDSYQGENHFQYEQYFVNFDQSEDDSMESDTEEAGEEEDEDGSMESEAEEIGDEEEEEEDGEIQAEDDTEEVSGVASDPELMEIEGTLWTFLGDLPEFNPDDKEFSRGSKGLKKAESAIEIITEFHDGNDKEVDSCLCCLEGFTVGGGAVVKTRCSHLFHRDCLYLWLSRKDSCPLCRSKCATWV